ncbi:MAG: hypothetical protein ABIQ30_08850 [Devosia sp.]
MSTTKLPDNGHTLSHKIGLQDNRQAGGLRSSSIEPADRGVPTSLELHQQIHDALETAAFKLDAAGKSGEELKLAVATAISTNNVLVEVISVGLSETAESYAATPYEAIWITSPNAATEASYFDV